MYFFFDFILLMIYNYFGKEVNMERNLVTISEAAQYLGVSIMTLRRWDESGKLKPIKTVGKHRRYDINDLNDYLFHKDDNIIKENSHYRVVCYARVSSNDQKDDLERQAILLEEYCKKNNYKYETIKDLGSGLNYKKKGLNKLINKVINKEVDKIIISYKDRLIRFGYELIEHLCNKNDVEIVVLNNEEKDKNKELVEDMLSIITVFSSRLYGSRSKKHKKIINEFLEMLKDYDSDI